MELLGFIYDRLFIDTLPPLVFDRLLDVPKSIDLKAVFLFPFRILILARWIPSLSLLCDVLVVFCLKYLCFRTWNCLVSFISIFCKFLSTISLALPLPSSSSSELSTLILYFGLWVSRKGDWLIIKLDYLFLLGMFIRLAKKDDLLVNMGLSYNPSGFCSCPGISISILVCEMLGDSLSLFYDYPELVPIFIFFFSSISWVMICFPRSKFSLFLDEWLFLSILGLWFLL